MQGKFLRRHRIPKNDIGDYWHWKDFNLKCDMMFYGRVFRVVNCDEWTKVYYFFRMFNYLRSLTIIMSNMNKKSFLPEIL